jgi:hypothetical protein
MESDNSTQNSLPPEIASQLNPELAAQIMSWISSTHSGVSTPLSDPSGQQKSTPAPEPQSAAQGDPSTNHTATPAPQETPQNMQAATKITNNVQTPRSAALNVSFEEPIENSENRRFHSSHIQNDDDLDMQSLLTRSEAPLVPQACSPTANFMLKFLQKEKPPVFDLLITSPPEFLDQLDEYFTDRCIFDDKNQLLCAKFALKDTERDWLFINRNELTNFSRFREKFLESFWEQTDRNEYRDKIFSETFRSVKKDEPLVKFFRRQYARASKYFPDMSFSEMKEKFSKQVPDTISAALCTPGIYNVGTIERSLKELDKTVSLITDVKNRPVETPKSTENKEKPSCSQNFRGAIRQHPYQSNYSRGGKQFNRGAYTPKVNMLRNDEFRSRHTEQSFAQKRGGLNYSRGNNRFTPYTSGAHHSGRGRWQQPNFERRDRGTNNKSPRFPNPSMGEIRKELASMLEDKLKSFSDSRAKNKKVGGKQNKPTKNENSSSEEEN